MRDADPHARVTWVAGELSIHTLATTRLAETWIHTGDVADAVDVMLVPTDRLRHIARLAWRTLPYAFGRAGRELSGPVAFELIGPDGERVGSSCPTTRRSRPFAVTASSCVGSPPVGSTRPPPVSSARARTPTRCSSSCGPTPERAQARRRRPASSWGPPGR